VQLNPVQGRGQRGAHRARAAAQVDDDSLWRVDDPSCGTGDQPGNGGGVSDLAGETSRLTDEKLGAPAGYENPGVHSYPQGAELRPAEDVLKG
jgi:hypothetical protein